MAIADGDNPSISCLESIHQLTNSNSQIYLVEGKQSFKL
jgi:hypothetical protein